MGKLVTRFPNGVTDAAEGSWNANTFEVDPTKGFSFFEDFCGSNVGFPVAASSLAAASNACWTVTVTEGGAGDASAAVTVENGGVLKITTDAADNDLVFAQTKQSPFVLTAGKQTFFKTRFKLTDASANAASVTQSEFYFGLMVLDTDPLSSTAGAGLTDGIFFLKEDGDTGIDFYVQKAANTQVITDSVATLTVDTYTTLAFAFDGVRYVSLWKDDVFIQNVDLTTTLAAYLPDTGLSVSFGIKNGEAVAKVLHIDYIYAAQER